MDLKVKQFNGRCEECGGLAALFPDNGTVVIQNQENMELSIIEFDRVSCERGHQYGLVNWESQVTDPFEDGYTPDPE